MPALRVLPRPTGARRRRGVTRPDHDPHRRRRDGGRPRPPQHHRRRSGCRASPRPRAAARRAGRRRFAPSSRDIPTPHSSASAFSTRPTSSAWPRRRRPRCGASRARRFASRPTSVANGEASALVSAGHTGATVLSAHGAFGMLPGVDRPALAATIPSGDRPRHPARRRRQRRMPRVAPAAVRRDGRGVREDLARHRSPAHRAAVDRRGREQGHRADSRRASAAEGVVAELHRQRRGARSVQGQRRRDSLRRLYGQHRAESERRARRHRRAPSRRRIVENIFRHGRLAAVAARVPPVPPAPRLLRIRRRAAARRRRRLFRLPRPLVRQGRSATPSSWPTDFRPPASCIASSRKSPPHPFHDRIRLSRTRFAEGRHGPRAGRRVSRPRGRCLPKPTTRWASR